MRNWKRRTAAKLTDFCSLFFSSSFILYNIRIFTFLRVFYNHPRSSVLVLVSFCSCEIYFFFPCPLFITFAAVLNSQFHWTGIRCFSKFWYSFCIFVGGSLPATRHLLDGRGGGRERWEKQALGGRGFADPILRTAWHCMVRRCFLVILFYFPPLLAPFSFRSLFLCFFLYCYYLCNNISVF